MNILRNDIVQIAIAVTVPVSMLIGTNIARHLVNIFHYQRSANPKTHDYKKRFHDSLFGMDLILTFCGLMAAIFTILFSLLIDKSTEVSQLFQIIMVIVMMLFTAFLSALWLAFVAGDKISTRLASASINTIGVGLWNLIILFGIYRVLLIK